MARGPSWYAFNDAYKDAQRAYDDAIRYSRPAWEIKDLKQARDRALENLKRAERTGE